MKATDKVGGSLLGAMIHHSKPYIINEDIDTVKATMKSGMIASGSNVQLFEDAVSKYIGAQGGVAVGSGTAAIALSLLALEIGHDDEVILPSYVCDAVLNAVVSVRATPVICDVGERWYMTREMVAAKISKRTKAIILVHIFGIAVDTEKFLDIGIPVIEDCCQLLGSEIGGKKVGTVGTMGVFSFHATKCLATGEGGMVTSNIQEIICTLRNLKQKGRVSSPMTDIQAALGISQLSHYNKMLKRRKEIAQRYLEELPNFLVEKIASVKQHTIYFRFPISQNYMPFDSVKKEFEKYKIQIRRGVDSLRHRDLHLSDEYFPCACKLFAETISLPIYPALREEEVDKVIFAVNHIFN